MKIGFFGGDRRVTSAMEYLKMRGIDCVGFGIDGGVDLSEMTDLDAAVLPWPCEKGGFLNAPALKTPVTVAQIAARIPPCIPVIGGPSSVSFARFFDLSRNEALKARNAVSTAEGALALLVNASPRTVNGLPCLVTGYGAVGKRLARVLSALGAKVTVAARNENVLQTVANRYCVQHLGCLRWQEPGAVFNTVPAPVLGREFLGSLPADTLLFELASAPGGYDRNAADALGFSVIDAPGIPGKTAPVTAGEDLAKTVIGILDQ